MSLRIWLRDNIFSIGKRARQRLEIVRYLETETDYRLNIGCGGNRLPGWLNVDRFPPPGATFIDAAKPMPFDDATFGAILCEHMIEHIPKPIAIGLLVEMRRVLRPGGMIRIVTPDLGWLSRRILEPVPANASDDAYLTFLSNWHDQAEVSWCDAINLCFSEHGHHYLWSIGELQKAMVFAGFRDIIVTRAGHPTAMVFADADGHGRLIGDLPNALEAFGLEGRLPL